MTQTPGTERHTFQAEVHRVLHLVIHSLYSNTEIFLRELISNASDALDKRRIEALQDASLGGGAPEIRVIPDQEAKTLTLWDNGIGMSREELIAHLGTIAQSGTRAFVERLQEAQASGDATLIGQFGVGFYSAFIVADRVEVVSRRAGSEEAWRWSSDGVDGFEISSAERAEAGTSVVLHLKEAHVDFAQPWRLQTVVEKWSDYLDHPVKLVEGEESRTLNQEGALWRRPVGSLSEEQYGALYRHVTHGWGDPLGRIHVHGEGTQSFYLLLWVPEQPPLDLFDRDGAFGLRLYVRRVLIRERAEELLPSWLRFVRGVVDSDDLPLNVSREMLQDSKASRVLRRQVVKKSLEMLEQILADDPAKFETLWRHYGKVLKEGIVQEPEQRDRILGWARFTSTSESQTTLSAYVGRMKEGQPGIYYVLGSGESVKGSPHLERLRAAGWEVLLLTDPVDHWVVESTRTWEEKPLIDAMSEDADLGEAGQSGSEGDAALEAALRGALGDRVSEIRWSRRLVDSPACLVAPSGGLPPYLERLMQASRGEDAVARRRVLEVNPDHGLVQVLSQQVQAGATVEAVRPWAELVYDAALLGEGSPLVDPGLFARRLGQLMSVAATQSLTSLS